MVILIYPINNDNIAKIKKGTIRMLVIDDESHYQTILLKNISYISISPQNIISISK